MHPYPHTYVVTSQGTATGPVSITSPGVPPLTTAPPKEFDGPGDVWSPETLLVAAIADCYILTFRGVARAAKLEWQGLECTVEGVLERVEGVTRFSGYTNRATLTVKAGADQGKATELLERAERVCLVNNSLLGKRTIVANVVEQ
ncbi:MAG: OsmC family protein [Proteobacteria bacterium]|nr:OsmC family protein [Pseudomonadota bacterium]